MKEPNWFNLDWFMDQNWDVLFSTNNWIVVNMLIILLLLINDWQKKTPFFPCLDQLKVFHISVSYQTTVNTSILHYKTSSWISEQQSSKPASTSIDFSTPSWTRSSTFQHILNVYLKSQWFQLGTRQFRSSFEFLTEWHAARLRKRDGKPLCGLLRSLIKVFRCVLGFRGDRLCFEWRERCIEWIRIGVFLHCDSVYLGIVRNGKDGRKMWTLAGR